MPLTEKELIDQLNARLKGITFSLVVNDSCFICGRPASGYIVKSENPGDWKAVCNKCGTMISLQHHQQGRNIVILATTQEDLKRISTDFNRSIKHRKVR